MDFGLLKKVLREIADGLDHRVMIPGKSPTTTIGENIIELSIGGKHYVLPKVDCVVLPLETTSAENPAGYVLDCFVASGAVPKNVRHIEMGVDEGPGQGAWATWERT